MPSALKNSCTGPRTPSMTWPSVMKPRSSVSLPGMMASEEKRSGLATNGTGIHPLGPDSARIGAGRDDEFAPCALDGGRQHLIACLVEVSLQDRHIIHDG